MTVLARTLLEATQIPVAATTQYTTAASTRTIVDKMTATNTTGATVTFTVYLVAAAGASGPTNRVIAAQAVAAGITYLCPEVVGHVLNPGDMIVTEASAVAITMRISGREVT